MLFDIDLLDRATEKSGGPKGGKKKRRKKVRYMGWCFREREVDCRTKLIVCVWRRFALLPPSYQECAHRWLLA